MGELPDKHAFNNFFEAFAQTDVDGTTIALCGTGEDTQPWPVETPNPGIDPLFDPLALTDEDAPGYSEELNDLAERTNAWFRKEAKKLLTPRRQRIPDLMLTWWFGPNGRQLAYARPHPKPKVRPIDTSALRLLWRKIKLFFGWRPKYQKNSPASRSKQGDA